MEHRFGDRTAMITGAAHGIGLATARRLHAEGARVVLADRDAEQAERAGTGFAEPDRVMAVGCDVTDRGQVDAAVAATVARFGGLDLVACVAGGSTGGGVFAEIDDDEWQRMTDLNLFGVTRTLRAAEPHLRDSGRAGRGPAAVLVSSVNGLAAWGEEPYAVAKAGLVNLARNLAVRWGPDGVRVNVVAPGTIRTRVWDSQPGALETLARLYPLGRVGEADEVAAAVAFLGSADAAWITGVTLPVDGGGSAGPRQAMQALFARSDARPERAPERG